MENTPDNILEKDKLFEIGKKDIVYILIISLFSVLMSSFGIIGGFRGGFAVASILLTVAMTFYFIKKGIRIGVCSVIYFIEVILLSAVFMVTSNGSVRFFSFVGLILLSFLLYFSFERREKENSELDFFTILFTVMFEQVVPNIPITARSLFTDNCKGKKTLLKTLIGIGASLPFLIVIIPLLMSSDEAFSGLIQIFSENILLTFLKIILGLVIAYFLITFCLTVKNDGLPECAKFNLEKIDQTAIISFLSSISVCYIAYLVSQLAYFFSAFKGLLPNDYSFTLSSYARRGFFEMCVIAVINFLLIFCVSLFSKQGSKKNIVIKIISTFICVFTLVIIATALSKMFLYIDKFGMTKLRIVTSAFMVFLAVMFVALIVKIFAPKILIVKFGIVSASIVLIVLGLVNVNKVIAEYNYTAYIEGKLSTIDVSTIYELGDEGVPYLIKLTQDSNVDVKSTADHYLHNCYVYDYYEIEENETDNLIVYEIKARKYDGVGQFGLSRSKAYNLLDEFLEDNPYFLYENIQTEESEIYYN